MRKASSIVLIVASLALATTAQAQEAPSNARVLSLEQCISIALTDNVEARSSAAEVAGAEAAHTGTRGDLFPHLRAEGSLQQWNSAFTLPFALPGASGPPPELTVRDAFTWTVGATIVQPITGLLGGLERHDATGSALDSARLHRETTRRDVSFRVAEEYLRLLEAKRLIEVASASVGALEAQRKQAASLVENGVIAKNDLLRAELALSNAKQREIRARGNVVLARGRLASLLGLPAGAVVDVAPISVGEPPREASQASVESAEAQANRRLELRASDARIEQAASTARAARKKLLPQFSAVGNYTHVEGSAFQQKNAAYVGVVGTWDVWDFGAMLSASHEADARQDQAKLARVKAEEQARLDARQAAVDVQVAREALEVARTAVTQAEENYRIVSRKFEQAAGTAFDVVDAEALLTEARARVETATYGWLVAQLTLQRATGETRPHVR